jgi:hypothetical protein
MGAPNMTEVEKNNRHMNCAETKRDANGNEASIGAIPTNKCFVPHPLRSCALSAPAPQDFATAMNSR